MNQPVLQSHASVIPETCHLLREELQINKLVTLISDLLDVKKIESGQLQYNEEVFDLNKLVEEEMPKLICIFSKWNVLDSNQ